ncbi:DMT family transporter [Jatrophihabitans sp. DSM 45814]
MSQRGWALFAAMCVIWGLPYLFIRIAVEHISPGSLVFLRTGIAALVLLPLALWRAEVRPVLVRWRWLIVFAAIEIIGPWLLLSDAERHLNSSLAGLLVAAVPLIGAVIAWLSPSGDRVNRLQLIGLLTGLAGVAALVGLDFGDLDMSAVAEMAIVSVCYAVGPIVLARRLSDLPGLGVIACALTVSAGATLPFVILTPPNLGRPSVVLSVIVLALVCTALAFVLFFELIATIGPTRSTVITYVNPAVALLLGVIVLNEDVTSGMLVGFPLILVGSILGARKAPTSSGQESTLMPAGSVSRS